MTTPLLSVRDLQVSFAADEGRIEAVRSVSFDVPPNSTVALVGESGSGKSVVSQAILGILPEIGSIETGEIWFNDAGGVGSLDLASLEQDHPKRRSIRGGRISIIFQEPMSSLSPLHTIGDQIGEALRLHREVGDEGVRRTVIDMLAKVGFPNPAKAFNSYPFELSGGLRQRAMIAMALICHPALLIADEPTTALDVSVQAQILQLMRDLQRELDMAILFITHDLGVVANIADHIIVMYRGRVMESGPCRELMQDPKHPYLQALMHAVPTLTMDRSQRLQPLREVEVDAHELMSEGAIDDGIVASTPLLEVKDLTKSFALRKSGMWSRKTESLKAVDSVSFVVHRGESFALVGESGSGKTTLSKAIMRAITVDEGRVTYHAAGGPIDVLALEGQALQAFRRTAQYVFQDPFSSLNPRMTVADLIAEPLIIHGWGDGEARLQRVRKLIAAVGLDVRHLRRYPHSFSGGQRQRIGIARALALQPEFLLLDEPVSALDVSVQAQILNLLKDLQVQLGLTYLFVAHNLAVVRYVADRVSVMCRGRIVEMALVDTLFENPVHPYTQSLLAAVPEPNVDQKLNFQALTDDRSSDPSNWPSPYCVFDDAPMSMVEIEPDHWVLTRDEEATEGQSCAA